MTASLALALTALRSGLAMRSRRRRGAPREAGARRRHLRLAKTAVAMILAGFALGLASSTGLRGWDALASAHGQTSLVSLALFSATAFVGRQLERGRRRDPEPHAWLALAATLAGAASLGTGFVLLP